MSVSEEGLLIGQKGCQTGTVHVGQTGCVFPPRSPVTTETFWTSRTEPTVPLYQREMGRRGGDGLPFYCFFFFSKVCVCVCVHRDKKHVLSVCVCAHACACVCVIDFISVGRIYNNCAIHSSSPVPVLAVPLPFPPDWFPVSLRNGSRVPDVLVSSRYITPYCQPIYRQALTAVWNCLTWPLWMIRYSILWDQL